MNNVYEIVYEPRIQDPVVVATFTSELAAYEHLEKIQEQKPKAGQYHTVVRRAERVDDAV